MGNFAGLKLRFAVCTKSGVLVDQHFGHAQALSIFDYEEGNIQKIEIRPVRQYCSGKEDCDADQRMQGILDALADCDCVICLRIGPEPIDYLQQKGIAVVMACDRIEIAIEEAARRLYAS